MTVGAPDTATPPAPPGPVPDGTPASESLTHRATVGAAWGMGSAVIYQAVSVCVQISLTYLLTKGQYGTYGIAFQILNFAALFQQVGFNEVLQHRRTSLHLWLNPAVWLAGTLGLIGSLVAVLAAWPAGLIYADPDLTAMLLLIAPVPFIRSLNVVPIVQLNEAMRFRALYAAILLAGVCNSVLTLVFARFHLGAYSYATSMLIAEPLYTVFLWRAARPDVRMHPQVRRWRFMLRDLGLVFGSNLARWVRSAADSLILGVVAGDKAVVGLYFFAFSVVVQVVRIVTLNLATVLLPALNRMQEDRPRQTGAFLRACTLLMFVGAPMCVGLAAVSELVVRVFLDQKKWHDLPPVLSVLAIGVVFRLLDEPAGSLMAAQGRFRTALRFNLFTVVAFVGAVLIGAFAGGALGTAVAVAVYFALVGPLLLFVATSAGGGTMGRSLRVFYGPLVLSTCAIGPWRLALEWIPGGGRVRDGVLLGGIIVLSALSYALLAGVLRLEPWREFGARVQSFMPARYAGRFERVRRLMRA